MARKKQLSVEEFWKQYEEKYNDKIISYELCKVLSGLEDIEDAPAAGPDGNFWGLVIATRDGFRFQHFPHEGWLDVFVRMAGNSDAPKEIAFFVPKEHILSVELVGEPSFLRRLFTSARPRIVIRYTNDAGNEICFTAEPINKGVQVVEDLRKTMAAALK
jgi:hypothetical protein